MKNQQSFIIEYVRAKAGDISAMGSTGTSFGGPAEDAGDIGRFAFLGLPRNPLQSCAWFATQARARNSDEDNDDGASLLTALAMCAKLSSSGLHAAIERSKVIVHDLETSLATIPADDWEPVVAGLKPSPKIDPRCLDTSFNAESSKPLPKWCPKSP